MNNSYEMISKAHSVLSDAPTEKCEVEKQYFNGINLDAVKDTGIRNHLSAYADALHDIDVAGLKTAYHAACIKPLLEGNTSGLQTDFVKFCKSTLNVGKAQAYNLLLAGNLTVMLYDEKGKNPIYTDVFTYELCKHDYKTIKRRKSFGQTQLVYLGRLSKKYDLSIDTIVELIDKGALIPSMSVKAIDKYISGSFITEKPADEKPADEKPTDETITFNKTDIETVKALLAEVADKLAEVADKLTNDGYKFTLDKLNGAIAILSK